ncbi:GAF and ANTAR domain-containing protein [Lentzea nigeriaca]|uniref:GAF and ANTAR domain-containing protein n=1 Tax=Lentzea nigeriaca TaxID=1128665 RepID=UPI00195C6892|nr:GAF and ANTAR domain-containing protein [Lentzea nigeriaca]MBM7865005.1 transcriptional regulator with GAF, ATPase, and Fis domain [Lentzea nigeriaca]
MERSEARSADDEQDTLDDGRPDPVERLDEAADALEALREVLTLTEPLDEVLNRLADSAMRAILDADGVTITVVTEDGVYTAAATEDRLIEADQVQYGADRGPCLQAATERKAVRAVVGQHLDAWPEFEATARRLDICAYLSVPLLVTSADGDKLVGSLNLYSVTDTAFDPFDESLMRLFTTVVCTAITSSQLWQNTRNRLTQLETALHSRAEIDQAKGMLMAVHGCSADEAFAMLVERSQTQNIKLREIVRSMLASVRKS